MLMGIIERSLRPIRQRIFGMIARGILESVDDSKGIQLVKVSLLKDEVRDEVERAQNYGFTSNPPPDCEVLALFVNGDREHGFIVACDLRDKRLKDLVSGEVAMWTDEDDHVIALRRGGKTEIKNSTVDLVASYAATLAALSTEPFIVNKATFAAEKIKIDTLKV